MAVSSSVDFSKTAAEIISAARSLLGIQADEESLQAHELQNGILALNLMLKQWQAEGAFPHTLTEGQFTLVQGDVDYVFGSGGTFTTVPWEITSARIVRSSNEIPMMRLSREDYFNLPNKTTQGYPTQFYYDRQRASGMFYVWPAPDSGAGTIKFTYRRVIMDIDSQANDFDLPQEWLETVTYNLAKRLAPRYGVVSSPDVQFVISEADRLFAILRSFDAAEGQSSITILPDRWS